MEKLPLNASCSPAAEKGVIRLPKTAPPVAAKRVLLTVPDGGQKLLKVDRRGDGGGGACLSPSEFAALGSPAEGSYDTVNFWGALRHSSELRFAAGLAVVAFVATVLAAIAGLIKALTPSGGATSVPTWLVILALAVFGAATVGAALKLRKDWKENF